MKKGIITALLMCALLTGCGNTAAQPESTAPQPTTSAETTTAEPTAEPETEAETEHATAPQEEVGYEGMKAVYADSLKDGEYDINVDSSSSMFKISSCKLKVADGKMTAVLTMNGTGYRYLYMGTEEDAAKADESEYIPFEEVGETHTFTVPVEALDSETDCAAFSDRKEEWYGRVLVFRADSLPADAFAEGVISTPESLGWEDGEYEVEVTLEGGSGKATVASPAKITVTEGKAQAEIIWSSNKYDYMVVDGEKIMPESTEENSIFEIPVTGFDYKMPVSADTIAMSTPHEIEYTLYFDAATAKKAE